MKKQETIKFDAQNFRKHSEDNKRMIRKSLEDCGAGRSVVIDNEGELIAGNGVYEQAQALGIKTRIVETDGSELVVVKRTDLATDDEKRKRLALADNATADRVEWDFGTLGEAFTAEQMKQFGIAAPSNGGGHGENAYSRKIEAPVYEPTRETAPTLAECIDRKKYDELVAEIEQSGVEGDAKALLLAAASRHIVFDYQNIAELYAHADEKVRRLMERSALVIIDFDKAIENGFVRLTEDLQTIINNEQA